MSSSSSSLPSSKPSSSKPSSFSSHSQEKRRYPLPPELWSQILGDTSGIPLSQWTAIGDLSLATRHLAIRNIVIAHGGASDMAEDDVFERAWVGLVRQFSLDDSVLPAHLWNGYRRALRFQRCLISLAELFEHPPVRPESQIRLKDWVRRSGKVIGGMEGRFLVAVAESNRLEDLIVDIKRLAGASSLVAFDLIAFCSLYGIGMRKNPSEAEIMIRRIRPRFTRWTRMLPVSFGCWCRTRALGILGEVKNERGEDWTFELLGGAEVCRRMGWIERAMDFVEEVLWEDCEVWAKIWAVKRFKTELGMKRVALVLDEVERKVLSKPEYGWLQVYVAHLWAQTGHSLRALKLLDTAVSEGNDRLRAAAVLAQVGEKDRAIVANEIALIDCIELEDRLQAIDTFRALGKKERVLSLLEEILANLKDDYTYPRNSVMVVQAFVDVGEHHRASILLSRLVSMGQSRLTGLLTQIAQLMKRLRLDQQLSTLLSEDLSTTEPRSLLDADLVTAFVAAGEVNKAVPALERLAAYEHGCMARINVMKHFATVGRTDHGVQALKAELRGNFRLQAAEALAELGQEIDFVDRAIHISDNTDNRMRIRSANVLAALAELAVPGTTGWPVVEQQDKMVIRACVDSAVRMACWKRICGMRAENFLL